MDGIQSLDLLFALRAVVDAIGGRAVRFLGKMAGAGGGPPEHYCEGHQVEFKRY